MELTRRKFLAMAGALGAACLASPGLALGKAADQSTTHTARRAAGGALPQKSPINRKGAASLRMMNRTHFEPLVGSTFQVSPAEEGKPPVALTLTEAKEHSVGPRQESFSLIFTGPADRFLPQRTYEFAHQKIGSVPIFLVPIGQSEDGYRYQAVFNRMKK